MCLSAKSSATHIDKYDKTRRAAFTLAEVLITLGIIGVVAAMTIPTLIKNYQKTVWTKQLQKSYATLNQGFQRMLADEGVELLSQTEIFSAIGGEETTNNQGNTYRNCGTSVIDGEGCKNFYIKLRKNFNINDIKKLSANEKYTVKCLDGNNWFNLYNQAVIIFADGSMLFHYVFYSSASGRTNNTIKGQVGVFELDINGLKGPNIVGRDIFRFGLGNNGIVYPLSSQIASEIGTPNNDRKSQYWNTPWVNKNFSCKNDGESKGFGCAARVLETGKMDY